MWDSMKKYVSGKTFYQTEHVGTCKVQRVILYKFYPLLHVTERGRVVNTLHNLR
jgi:hypothetical protein